MILMKSSQKENYLQLRWLLSYKVDRDFWKNIFKKGKERFCLVVRVLTLKGIHGKN
jgi:hypothetical protein